MSALAVEPLGEGTAEDVAEVAQMLREADPELEVIEVLPPDEAIAVVNEELGLPQQMRGIGDWDEDLPPRHPNLVNPEDEEEVRDLLHEHLVNHAEIEEIAEVFGGVNEELGLPRDGPIQDVIYEPQADGGAMIHIEYNDWVTDEEANRIRDDLVKLIAELKDAVVAKKAAKLSALRSKNAKKQPRDEKGRFRKFEEHEGLHYADPNIATEFRIPVDVYEGQAQTIRIPADSIWRSWTTTGSTTLTEVYAKDIVWNNWGGWVRNVTGGTTVIEVERDNATAGTSVTYSTDRVWNGWINMPATGDWTYSYTYTRPAWEGWMKRPMQTEEDRRRRDEYQARRAREQEEYQARMRREADERQARREAEAQRRRAIQPVLDQAEERAQGLLRSLLSAEQLVEYLDSGDITVRGSEGGLYVVQTRYAEYNGQYSVHGNVYETDEHGCLLGRICAAPQMMGELDGLRLSMPTSDGFVGQLLALRHNEAEFRRTGNWSHRQACLHPGVPILQAAGRDAA